MPPTSPAGGAAPPPDDPTPAEILRRIEAYLACPEIRPEDHDAAGAYLADHPEVAAARAGRPPREDDAACRFGLTPAEVLATAAELPA